MPEAECFRLFMFWWCPGVSSAGFTWTPSIAVEEVTEVIRKRFLRPGEVRNRLLWSKLVFIKYLYAKN